MDTPIRVPRNLTALIQHIQRLVVAGHYYWTADLIPVEKLPGFIDKWQPPFRLRADSAARAYRRRSGKASVHLCLHPDFLDASLPMAGWWMLSTAGKNGLLTTAHPPGAVFDCRTLEGRLRCGEYELLKQPKTFQDADGKLKTATTWTWRITPGRIREVEALLVDRAKVRDLAGITRIFECQRVRPMFAGVRTQIQHLAKATNKMLAKVGGQPYVLQELPIMRMQKLWDESADA